MKIPSAPAALIMSNLDQGGLFFERCGGGFASSSLSRIVALLPFALRGRLRLLLAF